jgi:hypothetical protein
MALKNELTPGKWKDPDNSIEKTGKETSIIPDDQRTPEQIAAAETDEAAETARLAALAGEGGTGGKENVIETGTFTPNALWEDLTKVEGFKMPEGLTKDNEVELLKKALVDNKIAEVEDPDKASKAAAFAEAEKAKNKYAGLDPEAIAFMKYKEANPTGTMNDFIKQRNVISDMVSLADKDFMKAHLVNQYGLFDKDKNPDGLTQEEIDDAVTSLETNKQLPLEAKKLKAAYRKMDQEQNKEIIPAPEVIEKQKVSEAVTAIKTDLNKLFVDTGKIDEISGIKVSKADVAEINTAFEKAVLPNELGKVPIIEMLQSDRLLWNFFATAYMGDEKIKAALSTAKESTKDQLISKLGLKPINVGGKQADTGKKNVITPGLWSIPDTANQ